MPPRRANSPLPNFALYLGAEGGLLQSDSDSSLGEKARRVFSGRHALLPLVLFMGFIGAALRYILEMALPAGGGFPAATLAVNVFGCFMLEIINQYVAQRTKLPANLVKSMGVGLVGAFTTISAFSTENLTFLQTGQYAMFALYTGVTVLATFVAALCGWFVSRALETRVGHGDA